MSKTWQILILIFVLFSFSSCATLGNIVQEPEVIFEKAEITNINFQGISFEFSFIVDNPNPIGIDMEGYAYNLQIEGNSFIKGSTSEGFHIGSNSKSVVKLPVTLDYKDLYNLFSDVEGKDDIDYKITNIFTFKIPVMGNISFAVEHEGTFPALKIPVMVIESLNLKKLGIFKSELELVIRLKNPNNFSLSLDSLDYNFTVNNKSWGGGITSTSTDFKEKGENRITIPFVIKPADIGMDVLKSAINGTKLDMIFRGKAHLRTGYEGFDKAVVDFDTSDRKDIKGTSK